MTASAGDRIAPGTTTIGSPRAPSKRIADEREEPGHRLAAIEVVVAIGGVTSRVAGQEGAGDKPERGSAGRYPADLANLSEITFEPTASAEVRLRRMAVSELGERSERAAIFDRLRDAVGEARRRPPLAPTSRSRRRVSALIRESDWRDWRVQATTIAFDAIEGLGHERAYRRRCRSTNAYGRGAS